MECSYVVAAVPDGAGGCLLAVGVALVADGPLPALGVRLVVAAVVGQVPHHGLAVAVVLAQQVLGLRVGVEAVPVAAAVEEVGVPARAQIRAADGLAPDL